MLALVFATENEAQPFLRAYQRGRFEGLAESESAHDDLLVVSVVGLGKIKATLQAERLLKEYNVSRLVHAGLCTALVKEVELGAIISAELVIEGDRVELSAPTYPRMPLTAPFDSLAAYRLVTQDRIVDDGTELGYWQRVADICDATSYAVAYVSATHGVPCHVVKVATSVAGGQAQRESVDENRALCDMSAFLIEHLPLLS